MIEVVDDKNIESVLPLIRLYQEFYECKNICDQTNLKHFSQFGAHSDKGCLFLFRESGVPVAFATVYFTYSSSLPGKVGVMNDLFTLESCRGNGIGRQLIEHCLKYAKANSALRIQWSTAVNNHRAQALYNSLNTNKSEWLYYTYTGNE